MQTTSAAPHPAACPAKRGFLNVGIATVVPGVLRELGTDPDPILKDAGLSRRLLKDRSCRLSVNVLGKLLQLCAERTACSHIGLVVGEKVTLSAFGDLGSLMKVSETFGDALRVLGTYRRLQSNGAVFDLVLQLHLYCRYGPLLGESGRGGASMSVAVWSGSLVAWERELVALKERIGPVFGRAETRATAGAFLDGLLSGVARKTGWLLAEQAGLERPYRMQSLLGRSHWDADALRDCVRADVIEVLGDRDGVLVVDETGFLKKGEHSVGVARQYSGTAGRIENCQVGVFLAYASRYGQALIDRRLYLPDVWAQDESKRTKAGVPEEITFVTKPQMACALIAAALDAGAPCAWVLADALYGSDSRLRRMLETREQPYVLAVRSNHCLRFWTEEGLEETNPAAMADALARDAWATHAAGEGAKGLRLYEWARIALSSTAAPGFEHWLLIRRSRREPDKRAYYFAFAPVGVSLGELAGAAGLRWTIEECFERAKDDLGLDHCEARSWHGWHRHMSLCLAAAAFLARLAADLRRATWGKANERSPAVPAAA